MRLRDGERTGVFGRSGSGKSTWAKLAITGLDRVIVFDPMDEYKSLMRTRIVHNRADALDQVRRAMLAHPRGFRIAYVPPAGKEAEALNTLSALVLAAQENYKAKKRGAKILTLVVEEMNLSFPVHGAEFKAPAFAEICSRGRASGIDLIGVSQGMAEVSMRFRRNLPKLVIFTQETENDIKAASAGVRAPRADVAALDDLEFLYKDRKLVRAGKISFPQSAPSGKVEFS